MDSKSAFIKLKPLCISILKDCTFDNINKLKEVVLELDQDSIQSLLEYIILPVRARLNTPLQENIVISCLEFLSSVFKKSEIRDWQLFSDIFTLVVFKLADPNDPSQIVSGYEELKLALCENLSCLVLSSSEKVLNEMYSLSFRPKLAHAIYMLNLMLISEKSKRLLIVVLSSIGVLTYCKTEIAQPYLLTQEIASEALASCLPGLTIALQKTVCGDYKQGYKVLTKALSILTDLIVLVVSDDSFEKRHADNTSSKVYLYAYKSGKISDSNSSESVEGKIPVILKDESWFKTVFGNLKIIIQNIVRTIAGNSHMKVRLQLLNFASSLLLKCTKTLENCVSILLQVVFELLVDENDLISSKSREFLDTFTEHFKNVNSYSLYSVIEENLKHIASEIISCKLSASDSKKLTFVRCLYGYVKILSTSFTLYLFSIPILEKIILSLLALLEFDSSVLNMIEEIPDLDMLDASNLLWPKKKFKYFDDEAILNIICKICCTLGQVQNSHMLIDILLEKLTIDIYLLQGIYLIGAIIKGFSFDPDSQEKHSSFVGDVLEVLLSSTLFDPPISDTNNSETEPIGISTDVAVPNAAFNKNILQICLVLEAIARCAECLEIGFKKHLIETLCPVMEKAGSCKSVISQYGCLCLSVIAQSCRYDSVNELIKDNADYVTNILLINFNSYFYKPEVTVVLRVVMNQCDSEALVLFRDLISQILLNIDFNQDKGYFLMQILYSVVVSIQKWFPCSQKITHNKLADKSTSEKSLKSAVLEYISLKKLVNDLTDETEDVSSEPPSQDIDYLDTEKKKDIPLHVNITCEIFKRCVHLQSNENPYFRMLVLDTVEQCIAILHDYEDQLHPLIHEFWDPFLNRFLEQSFISKAFSVLVTIVNECQEFVYQRTLKDVMPKLILYLKEEHPKSNTRFRYKNYQWSNNHTLQVLMLSEIGHLCCKLDVNNKIVCDVANVCLLYLEKTQPKVLQEAARKSLNEIAKLNSDAIWFLWNVRYSKEKVLLPSHDCFKSIAFPLSNESLTDSCVDDVL